MNAAAASPALRYGVVILAAGASVRMGRPKLLLPWGRGTVIEHLLGVWRSLHAAQTAVVVAQENEPLARALDQMAYAVEHRIPNPEPGRGMFGSIQCAARWEAWRPDLTHYVITLGDQPQVGLGTLRALLEFAASRPEAISQLSRQGRAKHPVVLPAREFARLRDCGEHNLKEYLAARDGLRQTLECEDAGLDFDLDHPEDYERALRDAAFDMATHAVPPGTA